MKKVTGPTPNTGRPRDPLVERRVFAATLDVFGRLGWSGFSIDQVISLARTGKSSVYLRWDNKEELLRAAMDELEVYFTIPEPDENMSLVEHLREYAFRRAQQYFEPEGLAVIRLHVEHLADPSFFHGIWDATAGKAIRSERAWLHRAIEKGELKPNTSVSQLGNAIEGSLMIHVLACPPELRDRAIRNLRRYVNDLVDTLVVPSLAT